MIKCESELWATIEVKGCMLKVCGWIRSMSLNDVQQLESGSTSSAASMVPSGTAGSLSPASTALDEVVYPYEDEIPMASSPEHGQVMVDTRQALENYFLSWPDVYLGMDMLVYYQRYDNTKRVTPDIFVAFDPRPPVGRNYRIWDAGKPPDVVWELAPDSAAKGDPKEKKELYRQMGVPEYWLFDTHGVLEGPRLQGFQLVNGRYRRLPAARRGRNSRWVMSPLLGLEHRFDGKRLRLWDPVAREYVRNGRESEAGRLKERAGRLKAVAMRERARERRFRVIKRWQQERARSQQADHRTKAAAQARRDSELQVAELHPEIAELEASVADARKQT